MRKIVYYIILALASVLALFIGLLIMGAICELFEIEGKGLHGFAISPVLFVLAYSKPLRCWILKEGTDEEEKTKVIKQIYSLLQKELSDTKANEFIEISIEDLRQIKKFVNYYGKGKPTDQVFIDLFKKQYSEFYDIYIN